MMGEETEVAAPTPRRGDGGSCRGLLALAVLAGGVLLIGCGGKSVDGHALQPIDAEPIPDPAGQVGEPRTGDAEPPPWEQDPGEDDPAAQQRTRSSAPAALQAEVDDLLVRYGEAFAALADAPHSVHDPLHPAVIGWHRVVSTGSELDLAVRDALWLDATENRRLYRPSDDGTLRRDHATGVHTTSSGIGWTNCAFTPWVEVHADTGAVEDDRPFERRGTGAALRGADGELVVVSLTDDTLTELPAGSTDPCADAGETSPEAAP